MPSQLPPLNALRAFEAAARHLSLRKAAAELHVTPAAISHQIRSLETALGVPVFKRLPQHVELTAAGEALLPGLTAAFGKINEAVANARGMTHSGRVTIAAPPGLASKWLAPRLKKFSQRHPDINLKISADSALVDSIREGSGEGGSLLENADLAIRSGHGRYPNHVVEQLFPAFAIPMCSPKLLEAGKPLETPEDLRHHTLLHHATGIHLTDAERPNWAAWLKAAGVSNFDVSRGPTFNQVGMAMEAAADGLGIVLGIPVLASADLETGRLVMPFSMGLPVAASFYLVNSHKAANEPSVAAARAWLIEEARLDRWANAPFGRSDWPLDEASAA